MINVDKKFILVLTVSFISAIYFGGIAVYCAFYAMLFISIIGYIYISIQKYYVTAEVKIGDTIYTAGDGVECLIKVKCSFFLPAPYIVVKSLSYLESGSGHKGEMVNITKEEDVWIRNYIKFYHRGIFDLGTMELEISDLFHIFKLKKIIDCSIKLKVYPRIYEIIRLPVGGKDIYQQAVDIRSTNEDIFTIKDVRRYNFGDSLKKVHWKVSAKHGELFVKNSDSISGQEFAIFLDMNKNNMNMDEYGQKEEAMIDLCVSMIKFMQIKNICTKVFVNTSLSRCIDITSKEQFDALMDFFLTQKSDGEDDIAEYLYKKFYKLQRNIRIALITSRVDEVLCNNISIIRNYGYNITIFYNILENDENIILLSNMGIECISIENMLHSLKGR
ncbi:hypothetical protein HMPREF1982_00097 [Clostridiales bacterium oral taxon 876 str. F0540]|nr:hypothetical protein HMPREF1982_00097 [Clostridiales bacterium oral taxon 876 str. F0540]